MAPINYKNILQQKKLPDLRYISSLHVHVNRSVPSHAFNVKKVKGSQRNFKWIRQTTKKNKTQISEKEGYMHDHDLAGSIFNRSVDWTHL